MTSNFINEKRFSLIWKWNAMWNWKDLKKGVISLGEPIISILQVLKV